MKELTFTPDWNGGYFNVQIEVGHKIEVCVHTNLNDDPIKYESIINMESKSENETEFFFYDSTGNLQSLKDTVRAPKTYVYIKE